MQKIDTTLQTYESLTILAETVFDELSAGFVENIYHKAYVQELQFNGILHETEKVIPIFYKNVQVGHVRCDVLVENNILIEFKAVQNILPQHLLQVQRYASHLNIDKMMLVNYPIQRAKPIEIHIFTDGQFHKIK